MAKVAVFDWRVVAFEIKTKKGIELVINSFIRHIVPLCQNGAIVIAIPESCVLNSFIKPFEGRGDYVDINEIKFKLQMVGIRAPELMYFSTDEVGQMTFAPEDFRKFNISSMSECILLSTHPENIVQTGMEVITLFDDGDLDPDALQNLKSIDPESHGNIRILYDLDDSLLLGNETACSGTTTLNLKVINAVSHLLPIENVQHFALSARPSPYGFTRKESLCPTLYQKLTQRLGELGSLQAPGQEGKLEECKAIIATTNTAIQSYIDNIDRIEPASFSSIVNAMKRIHNIHLQWDFFSFTDYSLTAIRKVNHVLPYLRKLKPIDGKSNLVIYFEDNTEEEACFKEKEAMLQSLNVTLCIVRVYAKGEMRIDDVLRLSRFFAQEAPVIAQAQTESRIVTTQPRTLKASRFFPALGDITEIEEARPSAGY